MGHLGHDFENSRRPRHDGAVQCLLCLDNDPHAEHEWCDAAGCLVCEGCCRSLMSGDPAVISSVAVNADRTISAETLFHACSECQRGRRFFAEQMLEEATEEDRPC